MIEADRIPSEAAGLLTILPEDQQQAIMALAGGLNKIQAARSVGVSYRTMLRWTQDEQFTAARRAISGYVCSHQVRVALEAFFEVMEKDRKAGRGSNVRWFLSRTLFADFEMQRANNRRAGVNVVFPVSVKEAQERTSSVISHIWKSRQEDVAGGEVAGVS